MILYMGGQSCTTLRVCAGCITRISESMRCSGSLSFEYYFDDGGYNFCGLLFDGLTSFSVYKTLAACTMVCSFCRC